MSFQTLNAIDSHALGVLKICSAVLQTITKTHVVKFLMFI